jgi:hypothetical protein
LFEGAVVVEAPELRFGPSLRQLTLRVRNNSALRFQLRLTKAPAWLTAGAVELRPEGGAGISVRLNKEAPAGTQSVELEFEAANLHVAPNRNLSVRVPLKVVVAQ